ncbi:hypothetical protein [Jiangella mangrovi]|uniref:PH domain-containing protein n=1 Tax=Jiangella mangrovi TaxID=1524084 RepID=A0A7W9GTE1_9ACTN|nr:hypothetical protein [Jiangella mangrovi]MBB5789406.1 hypothetical protein [Jiangella mangrovi]
MPAPLPGPVSGAALVLRPSWRRYLRTVKWSVLPVVVLLAALLFRGGGFGAVVSIIVIVLASAVLPVYFRRAAITVTPSEIAVTGLLRTRRVPRDAVGSIITVALPRTHKNSKSLAHLYVLDRGGRRVARLKGSRWVEDDMRRLITALGIEPTKLGRLASPRALARRYPHAVPLLERYPVLAGALVVIPSVAAIILISQQYSS